MNVYWQRMVIDKKARRQANGHSSCVIWFTGLSGSGKSTLANALEQRLFALGTKTYVLDGDNIRQGLNHDLGFTPAERSENIRRIAEVAKLFVDAGIIVLTAFISPYQADRELARTIIGDSDFIEIYVECSLDACQKRDPKGLYRKALAGEIKNFTGISAPYEQPENPDILVSTEKKTVQEAVEIIIKYLRQVNTI